MDVKLKERIWRIRDLQNMTRNKGNKKFSFNHIFGLKY